MVWRGDLSSTVDNSARAEFPAPWLLLRVTLNGFFILKVPPHQQSGNRRAWPLLYPRIQQKMMHPRLLGMLVKIKQYMSLWKIESSVIGYLIDLGVVLASGGC